MHCKSYLKVNELPLEPGFKHDLVTLVSKLNPRFLFKWGFLFCYFLFLFHCLLLLFFLLYRWSGIRDDLTFLMEEDLSNITLCSLHCEMRNTEQLLGSLGLLAYRCNSLDECNESLSFYGPENSRHQKRIKVELRKGQQTEVTKSNVVVKSFSGKIVCYLFVLHMFSS